VPARVDLPETHLLADAGRDFLADERSAAKSTKGAR
jgi:hypothetical protein